MVEKRKNDGCFLFAFCLTYRADQVQSLVHYGLNEGPNRSSRFRAPVQCFAQPTSCPPLPAHCRLPNPPDRSSLIEGGKSSVRNVRSVRRKSVCPIWARHPASNSIRRWWTEMASKRFRRGTIGGGGGTWTLSFEDQTKASLVFSAVGRSERVAPLFEAPSPPVSDPPPYVRRKSGERVLTVG